MEGNVSGERTLIITNRGPSCSSCFLLSYPLSAIHPAFQFGGSWCNLTYLYLLFLARLSRTFHFVCIYTPFRMDLSR
jgi:hypothetical protein